MPDVDCKLTKAEWDARQKRINKYHVECMEVQHGTPIDGYDFSCDYENAPDNCGDCICNGGNVNPKTGNRPYLKRGDE